MTTNAEASLANVFTQVLDDPDYLAGFEPEGSGWNFAGWQSLDYRAWGDWVMREKHFGLPTADDRELVMRVVETNPAAFVVKAEPDKVGVAFTVDALNSRDFPPFMVGTRPTTGEEVVLHSSEADLSYIPEDFAGLARDLGIPIRPAAVTVAGEEETGWAAFIREALVQRHVMPLRMTLKDEMVRDVLEMGPGQVPTERERLLAAMQLTQQDLLTYGYADFVLG